MAPPHLADPRPRSAFRAPSSAAATTGLAYCIALVARFGCSHGGAPLPALALPVQPGRPPAPATAVLIARRVERVNCARRSRSHTATPGVASCRLPLVAPPWCRPVCCVCHEDSPATCTMGRRGCGENDEGVSARHSIPAKKVSSALPEKKKASAAIANTASQSGPPGDIASHGRRRRYQRLRPWRLAARQLALQYVYLSKSKQLSPHIF